ncbi:MAG: hypothetical protein Q9M48_10060 [Rhodobacterales bacterium]|nr:hypothetical protein [Rhodobacterales bacterium]
MDYDLALVIGLVLGVFSVPAVVSALSDGHVPRVASFSIVAAGALVVWSVTGKPGGYRIDQVPDVIAKVVARFIY